MQKNESTALHSIYGADGVRLSSPEGHRRALQDAVARGGVSVIECPLEGELLNVPPPWL